MEILHKLKSGPACNIPSWVSEKMLYRIETILIHVQIAICILKSTYSTFSFWFNLQKYCNQQNPHKISFFKVNFDFIFPFFLLIKYTESQAARPGNYTMERQ